MKRNFILGRLAAAAGFVFSQLPGVATAAPALHVEESATFTAPPAVVWKFIGNFSSLGWHPVVAETTIVQGKDNQKGAVRSIKTQDGAVIVEKLQARDARKLRLRYEIVESPLPVSGYVSELQVVPAGQGSRVVWKSDFNAVRSAEVDDTKARDIISGIYKAGFDGLRAKLSGN
jgi:mxaD protein